MRGRRRDSKDGERERERQRGKQERGVERMWMERGEEVVINEAAVITGACLRQL